MSTRAIVKSVLSGDTVIIRPKEAPEKGKPAKEKALNLPSNALPILPSIPYGGFRSYIRSLHIAGISSPRMGSTAREDEASAFPAREFLRALVVGKEVAYTVTHTVPSSGGPSAEREFATILIAPAGPGKPPQDVAQLIVSAGWAKLRDGVGEGDDAVRRLGEAEAKRRESLRNAEAQAKAEGRGLWDDQPETQRTVSFSMPPDPQALVSEYKDKDIDALVEQVRDATQYRVRLMLDDNHHQYINLTIAGAKAPRASNARDDASSSSSEPWGEEAKFFAETRILQRPVKVRLLSAPMSIGPIPFNSPTPAAASAANESANGGPGLPAATAAGSGSIIGTVTHPNGNIAEFLCAAGLAKVIDWHAGLLAPVGGLDKLRAAERMAKTKNLGLWEGHGAKTPLNGHANGSAPTPTTNKGQSFDATVVRIWSSDQISVMPKGEEKERRLQLASVRGPRGTGAKELYWANEAKEFLRKRVIGKTVHVLIDYVKPKEGDYEERECATIKYGSQNTNISEQLIDRGLATVLRHRRDDEDRSAELDKLIVAEQNAVTETRGVHSTKEVSLPRIVDASESGSRASQYLSAWKRAGRHPAVVDFVAAGSRFKLFLPKENAKITFVLAGIRAPRAARPGTTEKSEPYGVDSAKFSSKFMQRDVEISFDSTDKQGGFIGAMYVNGANVAVELVREGLGTVHSFTAESLPFGRDLNAAEEEAKNERKKIWSDYSGEEVAPVVKEDASSALAPEYLDVYVSAVKDSEPFGFSVQVLDQTSVASLEKLMSDFSLHHKTPTATAPKDFNPKTGDLVSAKFSEDNQWYRAKVKRSSAMKKEASLYFIDYGNEETLPFSRIRPLDSKFKSLPGQAKEARLSFVKLVPQSSEYGPEALRRFGALTEGRKLVANVDQKEGSLLHLRLIDPSDPNSADDPLACLNADLVREGLATIDKSLRYAHSYPQVTRKLQDATEGAKQDRLGIFEFGDVSED